MFSLDQWQETESALGAPILTNQVMFSLAAPYPNDDLVPWAVAHDRIVIAASPLAMGLLSCRYDARKLPNDLRRRSPLFRPENLAAAQPLFDTIRSVAARHDAMPAQIALAWVIHHPNVVAIPGASTVCQLEQNAAAADIDLTDDEMARLSEAAREFHPVGRPYTRWDHLAGIGRELIA
jgi:aryl-alcohol dehydrogenase-like predicted oxidoreductase